MEFLIPIESLTNNHILSTSFRNDSCTDRPAHSRKTLTPRNLVPFPVPERPKGQKQKRLQDRLNLYTTFQRHLPKKSRQGCLFWKATRLLQIHRFIQSFSLPATSAQPSPAPGSISNFGLNNLIRFHPIQVDAIHNATIHPNMFFHPLNFLEDIFVFTRTCTRGKSSPNPRYLPIR